MLKNMLFVILTLFTVQPSVSQEETVLPALQKRTDLRYTNKTRDLYTTIANSKVFDTLYPNTNLTCGYIIRHFFYTNIHINASENQLVSMDRTSFDLSENIEVEELTKEVIDLIGGMYFGGSEYEEFLEAVEKGK